MWKKISFVAVLGLSLCPSAAMAAFNPFEGIVAGIAQGLASGEDVVITSSNDKGTTQGGNVLIGHENPKQSLEADGDLKLTMTDGEDTTQAGNVFKGEVAVLTMQETTVGGSANLTSSGNGAGAVQAINLVTACSASDCAN
ncbi:hypothetical protein [Candidatus Electronema sp. PJ]|uniref:hypothetical protein n=1 Tax=Candidatus Electronema sp. PJ TaxID=3401572 RepID=UPI003AA89493